MPFQIELFQTHFFGYLVILTMSFYTCLHLIFCNLTEINATESQTDKKTKTEGPTDRKKQKERWTVGQKDRRTEN